MFPSTKYNEVGSFGEKHCTKRETEISEHNECNIPFTRLRFLQLLKKKKKKKVSFLFFCVKTLVVVMETFTLAVMC